MISTTKTVDTIVGKITDKFPIDVKSQIDPLTIIMIISLIISIIRVIQECNKTHSDVKEIASNVSVMEKMKIKREIRRTLGLRNAKFGSTLYDSFVEYGKVADPQELELLFNEVS